MRIDLIELEPFITVNRSWLSEIFQQQFRPFDGTLQSNTFPVFIVNGSTQYDPHDRSLEYPLFSFLDEAGHHFGLIHVMDEIYDHDLSAYSLPNCSLVFREYLRPSGGHRQVLMDFGRSIFAPKRYETKYSGAKRLAYGLYVRVGPKHLSPRIRFFKRQYFPRLSTDRIRFIPLGYTDKLAPEVRREPVPIDERSYTWSFCGDSYKNDRKLMLEQLSGISPNFIHEYRGFMTDKSQSGEDYWQILAQSVFVPCPMGNLNIDTYRLFEALEAKAIPLILKSHAWQPYDYYNGLLGDHPIPTFSSWKQAKSFVESIDSESIQELSDTVATWYDAFKADLKSSIHGELMGTAENRLLSEDLRDLESLC